MFMWPNARISVMGGDQAAGVLELLESEKRTREGREWPIEEQEAFKSRIRERYDVEGSPWFGSARVWDDGVIDPADTRRVLGLALAASVKPYEAGKGGWQSSGSRYGVFRM
jgi:3-methylcrotonyl-CoA carboxylase beta subunit